MNDKNHHQEMDGIIITSTETIKSLIHEVRGRKVMLDHDLAAMYNVETKNLKRAVRSNIERFPIDFMFELSKDEYDSLRCKNSTLKSNGRGQHSKYLPFVFTQEGIAMLSGLLRTPIAIQVNINIMRAFFQMQQALLAMGETELQLQQIRTEIKQMQMEMDDILHDQNDINESTRAQLDAISTAPAELQANKPIPKPRRKIGFVQNGD